MKSALASALTVALRFVPRYQTVVWGGRRMTAYRRDLPDGPIGESWDLADHERGMSVVAEGPLAGRSLRELVAEAGPALVGAGFAGGAFPLLIKLIDASDTLSVQVHPDDAQALKMGLGSNGKTECWYAVQDGGSLYQGTRAGVDRRGFETALATGRVAETLNRFEVAHGDVFFLPARTVHAIGMGCLLYEVQQTSDVTFRVYDWDRVGLDGKPRPLHLAQSLDTIDFARVGFGPIRAPSRPRTDGGDERLLVDCDCFTLREITIAAGGQARGWDAQTASVLIVTAGRVLVSTAGGAVALQAMQTALIPAVATAGARGWSVRADGAEPVTLLLATPKL